jgi:GNAT superfamily N-acetyltransferase
VSVQLEALADEVFAAASAQGLPVCQVERLPFGEVRRSPTYPDLVFLNGITDLLAPSWSVVDIEHTIAEKFPGIAKVRVSSRDPETIVRLGPGLIQAGYQAECRVAMVQVTEPAVPSSGHTAVRPLQGPADWQRFEELIRGDAAENGLSNAATEQLVRLYHEGKEQVQSWLLASSAGDAVGYVGLYQHRQIGYLHALYTRPPARRQGAGSALVNEASQLARARGCERLTLQCLRDSFLPGFYHRLGFRTVGEMWIWIKPAPS